MRVRCIEVLTDSAEGHHVGQNDSGHQRECRCRPRRVAAAIAGRPTAGRRHVVTYRADGHRGVFTVWPSKRKSCICNRRLLSMNTRVS